MLNHPRRVQMEPTMEPTNSMVRAAIQQAVELGLLPRHGAQNEYDWALMKKVLGAALIAQGKPDSMPAPQKKELLEAW
ncbi:hypothetical protein Q8A64_03835 [Oxalobacteraceae bacterium R-40]|uniref:Uncharacterized protein n=1 Tax=Keguizhuia sedimenti TaxID=3064264 RepID=A0ABU1BKL0_9BURK|nr:hypothetical protein [Oxalobacteraceae bacterium R-40]